MIARISSRLSPERLKADRILREEWQRLGWNPAELAQRRKSDPAKLVIAHRLRRETVLPMTVIAEKLHLGSPKSARARLREQKQKIHASASVPKQER